MYQKGPDADFPKLSVYDIDQQTLIEGPHTIPAQTGSVDVSDMMGKLIKKHGSDGFDSSHSIVLEIKGPSVPSIDLVDLPGLVQDPPNAEEKTREIVSSHIARHGDCCIYLVVLKGSDRPNNSAAVRMVAKHSLNSRCVGVFTMCDLLILDQSKKHLYKYVSRGSGSAISSGHATVLDPHGWVATSNVRQNEFHAPGGDHISAPNYRSSLKVQAAAEKAFFEKEMPDLVTEGRATCSALVSRINEMFLQHLKSTWTPKTISMLNSERQKAERENAYLGLPPFHQISGANDATVISARLKELRSSSPRHTTDC
jgi:hypothetical protein